MSRSPGPLSGLRVIAIEQAVAAPRDDDTVVTGMAGHVVWLTHGKRSVALDVKSDDGRRALRGLPATADVLLPNLGPGALERIISHDELTRVDPRLVACRISGSGPHGRALPRGQGGRPSRPGEAGVTANTGVPGAPAKPGVSLADLAAGIYAATAILAALRQRDTTGRAEHVPISMFDVLTGWMSSLLLTGMAGDVRFATNARRLAHRGEVAQHPRLEAEGRWRPVRLPDGQVASVLAAPFRISGWDRPDELGVPALGQHNAEVLGAPVDGSGSHDA